MSIGSLSSSFDTSLFILNSTFVDLRENFALKLYHHSPLADESHVLKRFQQDHPT